MRLTAEAGRADGDTCSQLINTDPRRGAARASQAACGSSPAVAPQTSGAVCCRKGVGSSMADHRPRTRSTAAARLGALVTQLTAAGPTTPAAGSYVWPTGGVFIVRLSRDRETEKQRQTCSDWCSFLNSTRSCSRSPPLRAACVYCVRRKTTVACRNPPPIWRGRNKTWMCMAIAYCGTCCRLSA